MRVENLKLKIFSDGARLDDFRALGSLPYIKGFTTNPTLMRKAGVTDYLAFVQEVLPVVGDRPISFEVVSDDFAEMKAQARKLSAFGGNVYVKIPITNTRGASAVPLVGELLSEGIKVNITAILALEQVKALVPVLNRGAENVVSVFAGRIADTGVDPVPVMQQALELLADCPRSELLWASPRELLNIIQAEAVGCHIITVLPDMLKKLNLFGLDLHEFSLDTVKMFYNDALASGLTL